MQKCVEDHQMQRNFITVLLLYYGHQDGLAIHAAIFRVASLITRIQL